jgi:enoyl-CoA hydratase/carnithine racemase
VHIELNRPRVRDALNKQLYAEVGAAVNVLADDRNCRAMVLSGAGAAFCAGIGIKEMMSDGDHELDVGRRSINFSSVC